MNLEVATIYTSMYMEYRNVLQSLEYRNFKAHPAEASSLSIKIRCSDLLNYVGHEITACVNINVN